MYVSSSYCDILESFSLTPISVVCYFTPALARQLQIMMITLFVLFFCTSVVLMEVEHMFETADKKRLIKNIPDALYFLVVTGATVGYGELIPTTDAGRIVVVAFIFIAIVTIPMQSAKLVEILRLRSR